MINETRLELLLLRCLLRELKSNRIDVIEYQDQLYDRNKMIKRNIELTKQFLEPYKIE